MKHFHQRWPAGHAAAGASVSTTHSSDNMYCVPQREMTNSEITSLFKLALSEAAPINLQFAIIELSGFHSARFSRIYASLSMTQNLTDILVKKNDISDSLHPIAKPATEILFFISSK